MGELKRFAGELSKSLIFNLKLDSNPMFMTEKFKKNGTRNFKISNKIYYQVILECTL